MSPVRVHSDTYVDSVLLLGATRAMRENPAVRFATVVMATPANVDDIRRAGIDDPALARVSANDLVLAVDSADPEAGAAAIDAGEAALFAACRRRSSNGAGAEAPARTIEQAGARLPEANVAVVSVPGPYAAIEAHHALGRGLHVLLFSDDVAVEEEVELKDRALALGRLVMGPGAGTAVLGGCGLGFANVVAPGRVGVVAAAGTGAQEVMSLLDRWGQGVTQVIGVGGRDLSHRVGGRMARAAVRALDADPATDVILLVSKPPADDVARAVIGEATTTPLVAALIGPPAPIDVDPRHRVVTTLEAGAAEALRVLGHDPPDVVADLAADVKTAMAPLDPSRSAIRGLFSGGTLCYEALVLLGRTGRRVHSNTPLDPSLGLPAPPGADVCLDLGEEEYTRGRPHPMIDPEARLAWLDEAGGDGSVAAILLDVVLGLGAHDDPAGVLAPACERITSGGGPAVIAHVLGTSADPQGLAEQRRRLRQAGCLVAPT
ncbi:MAG: protein FdrA, partial [Acidimicrobiales bacterium]